MLYGVSLRVDIFFRSESKGISEERGNFIEMSSFQMPVLAAALRMAPSVGSPMTFQAVLSFSEMRCCKVRLVPIPALQPDDHRQKDFGNDG